MENEFEGPNETVIKGGDQVLKITLEDTQAIAKVLVQAIKDSKAMHRDQLLRMTERAPAGIDMDGKVRVGPWLLQQRDGGLALVYRLQDPPPMGIAYAAPLERTGTGWKVKSLAFLRFR
jgi:hypothetical protein